MRETPKKNEIYRHFKGNFYKILTMAKDSETGEDVVVYEALYGEGTVYVRPLSMFLSPVDKDKYPEADQEYRFERQENAVDPGVMDFLDSETCEEKLKVLSRLHARVDDDMINTMAASLDFEIKEGEIDSRYEELKNSLMTRGRFECSRLR